MNMKIQVRITGRRAEKKALTGTVILSFEEKKDIIVTFTATNRKSLKDIFFELKEDGNTFFLAEKGPENQILDETDRHSRMTGMIIMAVSRAMNESKIDTESGDDVAFEGTYPVPYEAPESMAEIEILFS